MPENTIKLLAQAANANLIDPFRNQNIISLPDEGQVIVTGDIHGHKRNLQRIKSFADLENNPQRHLILQEIIHGGPEDQDGGCLSYKLLFDAARYKLKFPDRVHLIMGNHDTAFVTNTKVVKNGKEMNRAMKLALDKEFLTYSDPVADAVKKFLLSQPLAVKCQNGIWISHSLPADRFIDQFDLRIFDRELTQQDMLKPGSAYLLTWGRNHSQQLLDKMAEMLGVKLFILGHQSQDNGWAQAGENLIIVASEHNHGHLLVIDLQKQYNIEELIKTLLPLASIS